MCKKSTKCRKLVYYQNFVKSLDFPIAMYNSDVKQNYTFFKNLFVPMNFLSHDMD